MTATARLYGRTHDWSSQSMVTLGTAQALGGRLAGVVELHVDYEMEDAPRPAGAQAVAGVYTGPPSLVSRMAQEGLHEHRVAFLVPNSNAIPRPLLSAAAAAATVVATPSRWAKEQLDAAFAAAGLQVPVAVVPHGVFGVSEDELAQYRSGRTAAQALREKLNVPLGQAVVHWSTSAHQRKGTRELLEAWALAHVRSPAVMGGKKLVLILDPDARSAVAGMMLRLRRSQLVAEHVVMVDRGVGLLAGLSPVAMRDLLSQLLAVAQPSRGEGFGMVPLEARAAGCPVLATACTGHSEHLGAGFTGWESEAEHGVVIAPHGDLGPIDDGAGALAPTLDVEALCESILTLVSSREVLKAASVRHARHVESQWSWPVASRAIHDLVEGKQPA